MRVLPFRVSLPAAAMWCLQALPASIVFSTFRLEFPSSKGFRLTMAAEGRGVRVGSYGLRTFRRTQLGFPGFASRNGFMYLTASGDRGRTGHMLLDNGPADADPGEGVMVLNVSTSGWPDGKHTLLAYADNRPAGGAYVAARERFVVVTGGGELDVGASRRIALLRVRIKRFAVEPAVLKSGETFRVRAVVDGVAPDLCVMSDGTLACSYGRPGADVMFSLDNARTWVGHTCIHPERYSGYTALCEAEPGVLLYGYGVKDCLNEATGQRSNQLRVARLRVRRR